MSEESDAEIALTPAEIEQQEELLRRNQKIKVRVMERSRPKESLLNSDPTKCKESSDSEEEMFSHNPGPSTSSHCLIGKAYQATIPPLQPFYKHRGFLKCIWSPSSKLSELEIQNYCKQANQITSILSSSSGDNEKALYLLYKCKYNTKVALSLYRAEMEKSFEGAWNDKEVNDFEKGLKEFGKDFYKIKHKHFPKRKTSQLVDFYYLWKKTERGEEFFTNNPNAKDKYLINPGLQIALAKYILPYKFATSSDDDDSDNVISWD